jgi:hypothetical protein
MDLDKAEFGDGPGTPPRLPAGEKTKAEALAAAGISTTAANRYEHLVAIILRRGILG